MSTVPLVRRSLVAFVGLALFITACNPGGSASPSSPDTPETTQPGSGQLPQGTTPPGETTTTAEGQTTTTSDRELAPDFTLALGDGGTYRLSEGDRPVYLVFWAEW